MALLPRPRDVRVAGVPLPQIILLLPLPFTPTGLWVRDPAVSRRKPVMALELCFMIKVYSLLVKMRGT